MKNIDRLRMAMKKSIVFAMALLVAGAAVLEARASESASTALSPKRFKGLIGSIKAQRVQMGCIYKSQLGDMVLADYIWVFPKAGDPTHACSGTNINGSKMSFQSAERIDAILWRAERAAKALAKGNRQPARELLGALLNAEPAYAKIDTAFRAYNKSAVAALAKRGLQELGPVK